MALTELQRSVMRCLARNRSDTSYIAGGVALNRDWPRVSDDIDVFHDTDEQIVASAEGDIESLKASGFQVRVDVRIFGCVEASVRRTEMSETIIQWMSETRSRFFPLVRDDEWGARLHQVDLAVNKVLAASSRSKARDFVDLITIAERMCPLGPLIMAASGKPPAFSPRRILEEITRRGLSILDEEYRSVRGLNADQSPAQVREDLLAALHQAQRYLDVAPIEVVGKIAIDEAERPIEIETISDPGVSLRAATPEPEVIALPKDVQLEWGPLGSKGSVRD